jgi:hypothetical protein
MMGGGARKDEKGRWALVALRSRGKMFGAMLLKSKFYLSDHWFHHSFLHAARYIFLAPCREASCPLS